MAVFERDDTIFVVLSDPTGLPVERIRQYSSAIKRSSRLWSLTGGADRPRRAT